ncbi:MAG: hypothetical protein HOV79_17650 [Hamadaea sp.]|nr:hypothetical protein [Hamadaea sp.]
MTYPSGGSQPSYRPQHGHPPSGPQQPSYAPGGYDSSGRGYEQGTEQGYGHGYGQGHEPRDPYARLGRLDDGPPQSPGFPRQVFPEQPDPHAPHQPSYQPPASFEPERPKKRRTGLKIFLILCVVLLAACGVAGYVLGKPIMAEYPATVAAGDSLAGFTKSSNPELKSLGDQMESDLKQDSKFDTTAAGVYQKQGEAEQKIVMVFAGSGFILAPEAELKVGFESMGTGGMTVVGVKDVDAGELGGHAQCGTSVTGGVKLAVCAWADHGAFGLLMFFDRGVTEAAKLLLDFRKEIQTR